MKSALNGVHWSAEEARDIWAAAMRRIAELRPSPAALAVFVQIMDLRLGTAPQGYLTQVPELARRTGFSEDSVSRSLAWLKEQGLIMVPREHRTNRISRGIVFNGFEVIPWACGKAVDKLSPKRPTPARLRGSLNYQDASVGTVKADLRRGEKQQRPRETFAEWAARLEARCRRTIGRHESGKPARGHYFASAGFVVRGLAPPAPS